MAISIKQARKILGKLAENISDEQIEKEIEVAEMLKMMYFSTIHNKEKSYAKT